MGKFGPTYMSTSQVINLIVIVIVCIPLLIFNEWIEETTGFPIWMWVLIITFGVCFILALIFQTLTNFKSIIISLIATALVVGASYLLLISVL